MRTHRQKLQRLSRLMEFFAMGVMAVIVAAGIYQSYLWLADGQRFAESFPGMIDDPALVPGSIRLAGVLLAWLAFALVLYALDTLRRMFRLFAEGTILDMRAAALMRRAGIILFVLALYRTVSHTVMVTLVSLGNAPGQRHFAISLGSDQLFAILLAGILVAIAHALLLAAEIEAENRSFV